MMRIYQMTATFGKLEHETLTLKPGLNIIEAPNEWGKSTWCAFLVNMLYGIDTRAKSTKTALAEKERYAPWSGSPMTGRIDLCWNGRDITIERHTKGRTPLGDFRAYETASGIQVPELTAANCGQTLLGVERSVFTRAGFLRFTDLPVTQDDALRRRLNALVTTGDERDTGDRLYQQLKNLKNNCRYHQTGLLPKAEAQRAQLEAQLAEQVSIARQSEVLQARRLQLEQRIRALENHKNALQYAAARDDAIRVEAAEAHRDEAVRRQQALEALCAPLPQQQTAAHALEQLEHLRQEWESVQMEAQMLPAAPEAPEAPQGFQGMTPEAALAQAQADQAELASLREPKKANFPVHLTLGLLAVLGGTALAICNLPLLGLPLLCAGVLGVVLGFLGNRNRQKSLAALASRREAICRRYGSTDPVRWLEDAQTYQAQWASYRQALDAFRSLRGDLDARGEQLRQRIRDIGDGRSLSDALAHWHGVAETWDAWGDARREAQQAEHHLQALRSMAKSAQPPAEPDPLTYTEAETNRLLSDASHELRQLLTKQGEYRGQLGAAGGSEALEKELERINRRIDTLEMTYAALDHALKTLTEAKAELQRRFAPRLTRQAQELFSQMTGGRYDRLTLAEDLTLHAGARDEDTLRPQLWRSDGTADQLYLSLRLAVARELTPDAPLILDDALVRFDDRRLSEALKILTRESKRKQVLLFTCQSREREHLPQ